MTTVLDPDLAHGDIPSDSFSTVQVLLGDQASTFATVRAGLNLAKFTVVGLNADGKMVALAPAGAAATGVEARGTLTFTGQPAAADTVTVNATVLTFVATAPGAAQVLIGATFQATAANLDDYINAHAATLGVSSSVAGGVLSLTANAVGTGGNAFTLAKSATQPAVSGATMAGGVADATVGTTEGSLWGITAQPIDATLGDVAGPVFYQGLFNHEALVWPAGLTTLDQRRAACVGSSIMVTALK